MHAIKLQPILAWGIESKKEGDLTIFPCTLSASMHALGKQTLEGQELDLPPVVLGQYGNDPAKKTILVYGHYGAQTFSKALFEPLWIGFHHLMNCYQCLMNRFKHLCRCTARIERRWYVRIATAYLLNC
jgi:hypothetical protein